MSVRRAEVISVGDELVLGQIVDTNAAYLATRLAELGIETILHTAVGDDHERLVETLRTASQRCDLVLVTGGIGPTKDDITRHAIAEAAHAPLVLHDELVTTLHERFHSRGYTMPESNKVQAMIPEGATIIPNAFGTAAGFRIRINAADVAVLPGVPPEMKPMFEDELVPWLRREYAGRAIVVRRLLSFGLPESTVGEKIGHRMDRGSNPLVGLLATDAVITIKIIATADSEDEAQRMIEPIEREARDAIGDAIFGTDDDTLEIAVARLLDERGMTIATAESCTGGLVASRLTDVPGISQFLLEGVVTYSNEAKTRLLGVPEELFATVGAVSPEVAKAMAEGMRERSGADIAVGITGIAGPGGGTDEKPVGLVYIAVADAAGTDVEQRNFRGPRTIIKDRAAKTALNLLRLRMQRHG